MNEAERLQEFYPFADVVLDRVEKAAQMQENLSWPEYVRKYNIPDPIIFCPKDGKPIEVLNIRPDENCGTIVYHQPMGCVLDSNIMLHVATLAAAQPEKQIIAVGNPGQPGRGYGKLKTKDILKVWTGDFRPIISPTLEYLKYQKIVEATHAGESYGADKAVSSAEYASLYDTRVVNTISVEPVSVAKAGILKMGLVFQSTSKHADKYLQPVRNRSQTFNSAENLKESSLGYALGLLRLSNLAIEHTLGQSSFAQRATIALSTDNRMKLGVAWGTASEFDINNERQKITSQLNYNYPSRVVTMPLENQTHAMNLDIFLNAAIISQLLIAST